MASDELDLQTGDGGADNPAAERRRRRRERAAESGEGKPKLSAKADERVATEIHSRFSRFLDRVAEWRDARDDDELAQVVREDNDMMSQGIVSLTNSFNPLRGPVIMFLNIIEPVLAFGRVVRILISRWFARRQPEQEREYYVDEHGVARDAANGQPVDVAR